MTKVIHKKLGRHKVWGYACEQNNTIELDTRLKGYRHLLYLTHEKLHILNPTMSETQVRKHATAIAKLLWAQSYRRVDNSKK